MEIPSSTAGVVKEMKVALGDKVNEGSLVLLLDGAAQGSVARPPPAAAAAAPPPAAARLQHPQHRRRRVPAALAELRVPDIGDFKDVAVIEVFIKPGDSVKVEQSLITVESDKASMEIPASQAGVVKEVKVKLGDKVSQGSLVAVIESGCRRRRGRSAGRAGSPGDAVIGVTAAEPQLPVACPPRRCRRTSPARRRANCRTHRRRCGVSRANWACRSTK